MTWSLSLVLLLGAGPPTAELPRLRDFGGQSESSGRYEAHHPASLDEVRAAVLESNRARRSLRLRGHGHSQNGSSLPRNDEILLFTDRLTSFRFEEPGTITVGAGAGIADLRTVLLDRGFELPVYPDGENLGGPTVGGYLAAGGIGAGAREHGGYWENVTSVTLVTGGGDVLELRPGDPDFPWLFGSMGQLGVFVSVRLKIVGFRDAPYPQGESGVVSDSLARSAAAARTSRRPPLFWFTLFIPEREAPKAREALERVASRYARELVFRPRYEYAIAYRTFHPPLIFPRGEPLIAIGIWGEPGARPGVPEEKAWTVVGNVAHDVAALVTERLDVPYRPYVQAQWIARPEDIARLFDAGTWAEFVARKRRLDPNGVLNCGVIDPCR